MFGTGAYFGMILRRVHVPVCVVGAGDFFFMCRLCAREAFAERSDEVGWIRSAVYRGSCPGGVVLQLVS